MTDRILRRREVSAVTGLPRQSIRRLIKAGKFPKPFKVGPQSIGWKESTISEWIENLLEVPDYT